VTLHEVDSVRAPWVFGLAMGLVLVLGCRGGPAPDSGFLEEPERMSHVERLPFQRVWYDPEVEWGRYTEVMIAPVNTEHLMEMPWWQEATFPGDRRKDARELGLYLQSRVFDAFEQDPRQRLRPIAFASGEPGPQTLLLEMALVELVPTKPVLDVLGGPTHLGTGTAAIEGRFRDGRTEELLATFADREAGKRSLLSAADLTWYGHAKRIIDDWAKQLVAIVNASEDERVRDSSDFTLKPW
jgi:hypothetical protein